MYKLFRDLGNVQGIARMTIMSLNGFIESIRQLKCSRSQVLPLYLELAKAIKKSEPKIIPLIHLMGFFEEEMEKTLTPEMSTDEVRERAIKSLEEQIKLFQSNAARVTENGQKYVNNGDVIIVHSASTVVTNILVQAKKQSNKSFKVIILDHSPERTRQTIQVLREADIEHIVAPAYNLSHHIEQANKMFVGAMTVTSDFKIVAPTGTAGTVSLCRHNKIDVHLFANSLHYSHTDSAHQLIYKEQKITQSANVDFSITTHSHDLVSLDHIDHIITEKGETKRDS
jgi:translation initiation factor eIF-2B subunit alpha